MSALPKPPANHVAATQFLMEQRFALWRTTCHIGTADLVRLNELLAKVTPDELRQGLAFLEGLVEWRSPVPQSSDAPRP
ncbi:MAG TPA: hypothetical protein VFZ00_11150 [Solirubrobacter sp.]|nr:hypothetical protein [Solirubrobacter sp.]